MKFLLYFAILVEGYIVLAVELLAIRQVLPFVGSGVEIVSIVIAGVLLPLAAGYHYGGNAYSRAFARARRKGKRAPAIRKILLRNFLISFFILTLGLSYPIIEVFFLFLAAHGIAGRLWQSGIYTLVFLIIPIFLLGQTVPLISAYFPRGRINEITGRMLFFSTTGAFFGSIFSTLVLMMNFGVHNTVIVTLGLLALLCIAFVRRGRMGAVVIIFLLFGTAFILNDSYIQGFGIVSDNAYNLARVVKSPDKDISILMLNRSFSSELRSDPKKLPGYFRYIQETFIDTLPRSGTPRDILIIGAGGFTIGTGDEFNNYTFVDIDPDMQKIAENDFLHQKLTPNKHFVADSARDFVRRDSKQYDFILIDVFQNMYSIPMECTTREFLMDVKPRLKKGAALAVNIIASPDFRDKFSARYDRTFADVFPIHNRQIINDFDPWRPTTTEDPEHSLTNVVYSTFNTPLSHDMVIYTDDKNTYSIDHP